MRPRKTDQAHAALQTHRAGLDMRQRRVLILADGQRSLEALTAMLGADTPLHVAALIRAGYLGLAEEPAPQPRPAHAPAAPAMTAPAAHRRSMVAARLYLLGMLELQRHPDALRLHAQLQRAADDGLAVQTMREALQLLPALTSTGYVQRIADRLREVLPEDQLHALETPTPAAPTGLSPAAGSCASGLPSTAGSHAGGARPPSPDAWAAAPPASRT
ncbi:hypothetical protein QE438_002324 [Pseudoxanthomonas sp. SORGH_AS 997]|uniref:Bacterial transcriptional activator domain-containing protein n=1 Tax=Pseudoxanthomonas winnipegensis TaxID=2480810 RepID=A0AAW8G6K3_9GAMM|nr:hypothetical protein [Pseudoxanthomonas winnipegensis]MDQ1134747.1 hypothetical protein [Pseudoxanthomonas winnipegensis]MDR6139020.1 hypothetical protein [Pseudoxanthomonas sp. SORGH_AS_0997]